MTEKPELIPGTDIKTWRGWCDGKFAQFVQEGVPKTGPAFADRAAALFPLSLAGTLIRESLGRYANTWLNNKFGRAATPKAPHKTWAQMEFDELLTWVREQQARVGAIRTSLVAQIEDWLNAHPEVQFSVSEILEKAKPEG
jgi:hypothetical protein